MDFDGNIFDTIPIGEPIEDIRNVMVIDDTLFISFFKIPDSDNYTLYKYNQFCEIVLQEEVILPLYFGASNYIKIDNSRFALIDESRYSETITFIIVDTDFNIIDIIETSFPIPEHSSYPNAVYYNRFIENYLMNYDDPSRIIFGISTFDEDFNFVENRELILVDEYFTYSRIRTCYNDTALFYLTTFKDIDSIEYLDISKLNDDYSLTHINRISSPPGYGDYLCHAEENGFLYTTVDQIYTEDDTLITFYIGCFDENFNITRQNTVNYIFRDELFLIYPKTVFKTRDNGIFSSGEFLEPGCVFNSDLIFILSDSLDFYGVNESSEKTQDFDLAFSPNPFNSSLMIDINQESIVRITDINGKTIFRETRHCSFLWEPHELPSGLYFVNIQDINGEIQSTIRAMYLK